MRVQPRQQILEIWRATAKASYPNRQWVWGGREGSNSISDAEQLMCLLRPGTDIDHFRLDKPDQTGDEVVAALDLLGDVMDIPQLLVRETVDYLKKYSDPDGTPTFGGGSYLVPIDEDAKATDYQLGLDVVESYAASVPLTLAALDFARGFRTEVRNPDLLEEINKLERLASQRLSAAMTGLLRSFAINVFSTESNDGENLLRTVKQGRHSHRQIANDLRSALAEIAAGLRDRIVGLSKVAELNMPGRLFECGWSWGICKGAPPVDFSEVALQRDGYALDKPYLHFTVVALDGIAAVVSERTRMQGLLNENQRRLADELTIRRNLTQGYWSIVASLGTTRWPLEDIPWRTVDGVESDYFSLLVTATSARQLAEGRDTDTDLSRLGRVLAELANRGRLTRRPVTNDPAIALHVPGVTITLEGTEDHGPQLSWVATDFAPMVLQRAVRIAGLITDIEQRGALLELADNAWEHLSERRLTSGNAAGLWDMPQGAFNDLAPGIELPSWRHTFRVVEGLVQAASLAGSRPLRSDKLSDLARDLMAEADHLFDQELLVSLAESGLPMRTKLDQMRHKLRRARDMLPSRPGTAATVLVGVLRELDDLAAARGSDAVGDY